MDKRIKVFMIITRLDKGGSAYLFKEIAENLDKERFELRIVSGLTRDPGLEIKEWMDKRSILYLPSLRREINPFLDLYSLFRLYRLIRAERPEIVHTHTSKAGVLGRIAAFLNRVPGIIHMPHGHVFYGYFGKTKTSLFIWIERLMARFTDKIITLTDFEKRDYISLGIGKEEKFITIHGGIDPGRFSKRIDKGVLKGELGLSPEETVIGWIGRLERVKGCEYFIRGSKGVKERMKHKRLRFLVVGDGSLRTYLERLARELGLSEDMIFMGERTDIPEIMGALDLFVLSSLNEGLGRVILEAMASRVPVIATEVGGVPEIVIDGVTGILVPPASPEKLAEAICMVLSDEEIQKRLISNAEERVRLFTLDRTIKELESLYLKISQKL